MRSSPLQVKCFMYRSQISVRNVSYLCFQIRTTIFQAKTFYRNRRDLTFYIISHCVEIVFIKKNITISSIRISATKARFGHNKWKIIKCPKILSICMIKHNLEVIFDSFEDNCAQTRRVSDTSFKIM